MRIIKQTVAIACIMAAPLAGVSASAQDESTDVQAEAQRPAATLADMAWLEGQWTGTGIGGNPAGEAFSYAGENQMVGHFWQADSEGGIEFYELITITPDGDSLTMRLKHFTGDLTGWEAKEGDAALVFPLVERSAEVWKFGPVTFRPVGSDKLQVSVRVKQNDGSIGSLDFSYGRVSSERSAE